MNFQPEKGIERLKKLLHTTDKQILAELSLFEMRLAKNRRDGQLFGDNDPGNRSELNRILFELDHFAWKHINLSFSDLCQDHFTSVLSSLNGQRPPKGETSSQPVSSEVYPSYLGTQKRWAVLIGIGNYEDRKYSALPVCVNDVNKIAHQLYSNESGFTFARIKVLVDDGSKPTTRAVILSDLQEVAEAAEEDDLLLFYFSGHGELEQEEPYLVTRDSIFGNLQNTALPVARIEEIMQASRAKAKVMILDACHAGEKLQSKGSQGLHPKFIERVYMRAQGMVILASCKKNQESYIWEEKNCSAYTYFLLEALGGKADLERKGFVSVDDIDKHVTNGMAAWTQRHNHIQTPTKKYIESHGQIIVSYYKKPPEPDMQSEVTPEAVQPPEPKQSSFTPTRSPSWSESETVCIRGETYILYRATIHEKPTSDGCAVLRSAQAQHVSQGNAVQLKQISISHFTSQGRNFLIGLKKEHRLALRLAQYGGFPRILEKEEITGDLNISTMTLVYEAWTGHTLREVFQQPGRILTEAEITSLLGTFIHICKIIGILHREDCSHRALTADTIILLGGDKHRPVLQNFGLAAYPARSGGKEKAQIQAPEQLYSTPEMALPGQLTDIYQLGVILITLITGQPFSSIRTGNSIPAVSSRLNDVIQRAVSSLPKNRWPTVMTFAAELQKIRTKER